MSDSITTPAVASEAAAPQKTVRLTCPKHGDVSGSTLYLSFSDKDKKVSNFLYCMPCLNELLLDYQEKGLIQKINIEEIAAPVSEVGKDTNNLNRRTLGDPALMVEAQKLYDNKD